jgi:hypothetical protein
MTDPVLSARGKIAYAVATKDPGRELRARQEISAARVERAIRKALEETPPLTDEARAALAMLLLSGGAK